jgi:uncharacterized Zn finger protein (UPF0148 family)
MPKVTYNDWIDEDPFHPCLKCGSNEFYTDSETMLPTCEHCGETLTAPKHAKPRKVVKKPFRLEEDWE